MQSPIWWRRTGWRTIIISHGTHTFSALSKMNGTTNMETFPQFVS
jgi:hypothetical protein